MVDIMGYWAGQPDEPLLLELAGEQPLLPPTFAAFCEDVRRLIEQIDRTESARRLSRMRDADRDGALSEEALRAYWKQRQQNTRSDPPKHTTDGEAAKRS